MTNEPDEGLDGSSNDRLILLFLGLTAITCIIGIIALAVVRVDAQPLVAIASASVGALATKVIGVSGGGRQTGDDEDDFAILGRAATKSIIAEAMRQMGSSKDD